MSGLKVLCRYKVGLSAGSWTVFCNVAFLNEEGDMIIYNSLLAKTFLNRKKMHYFMIFGCCFTRFKYLEVWEDMELRIHARQYTECFFLALFPALVLSVWLSVHIVCIPVTGTSVNPARSIGPALFAGMEAISQLWLFIVAPIVGAVIAVPVWKTIKGN